MEVLRADGCPHDRGSWVGIPIELQAVLARDYDLRGPSWFNPQRVAHMAVRQDTEAAEKYRFAEGGAPTPIAPHPATATGPANSTVATPSSPSASANTDRLCVITTIWNSRPSSASSPNAAFVR